MTHDRSCDFRLLLETAQEAAQLALSFFQRPLSTKRKADGTSVTEADLAVDALLAERLRSSRPDYGWFSEESAEHGSRLGRRKVWVVDPIDGTRAFIQGKDDWTVALALVEDGQPTLAVVVNPMRNEIFHACAGGGAFLNGRKITASNCSSLTDARIAASDGILSKPIWREPWGKLTPVWANSLAYRLALVACGKIDAAFALNPKWEWDVAAGALLVNEAGGRATTPSGQPLIFNTAHAKVQGFLAAAPNLHQMLSKRLSDAAQNLRTAHGMRV
jgi:myo-inositol-1(or 4)-monophosphatase